MPARVRGFVFWDVPAHPGASTALTCPTASARIVTYCCAALPSGACTERSTGGPPAAQLCACAEPRVGFPNAACRVAYKSPLASPKPPQQDLRSFGGESVGRGACGRQQSCRASKVSITGAVTNVFPHPRRLRGSCACAVCVLVGQRLLCAVLTLPSRRRRHAG